MNKKALLLILTSVTSLSMTSCSKKDNRPDPFETDEILYKGENLYFNVSDLDTTTFLNDFTHRNMRYDNDSVGEFDVGSGTGFAKNWETMAISFQNASKQVYKEDKFEKIVNYLLGVSQDDQGLIYNTPLVTEPALSVAGRDDSGYCIPQGWPFPSWQNSVGKYGDTGVLSAAHTTEFNFNAPGSSYNPQGLNWHVENGSFEIGQGGKSTGYGHFATSGSIDSTYQLKFYRDNLNQLLPNSGGIDTRYAPIVDMEIAFTGSNVEDYGIYFKVKGSDEEHFAPQSLYASTKVENVNGGIHVRQFFDMYLCDGWNQQLLSEIGVKFIGKDGRQYRVSNGQINFLRPSYDTRQSNATYQFILALYNYFIYTRDIKTLTKLMTRARKGLLFLTHALEGEKGLLSLEYLYGHDGITPKSINPNDRNAYHGIANGYWDLSVSPMMSLEANTYFYQALKAMAVLEGAMKSVEGNNPSFIQVKNRIPGEAPVTYSYTPDTLNALAETVKTNMQKDVKPVATSMSGFTASYTAGDYRYKNQGGFYNPETGRFVTGINEYTGEILDFGYTYLNLEAICAGIGTTEQQQSIMNWIDGKRTVEGDTSKGKDIYFYEFAPRHNTKDSNGYLGFYSDDTLMKPIFIDGGCDTSWSRQVQNGGAVIAWSYYDLVARSKVLGTESALKRLEEIKKWYMKVLDNGGNGVDFYDDYYEELDSEYSEDPNMYMVYSVQAAGGSGGGSLGLDAEFIESVIFIRAIPDALYGMDASLNDNLQFTYGENNKHKYFEIYNMKYGDAIYSLRSKKNVMEVFNISGVVSKDHKITFKYKTNKASLSVKVNNQSFEAEMKDGYACVTVPFGNTKVIFG